MKSENKEILYNIVCDYLDGVATEDEIEFLENYYQEFAQQPDGLSEFSEEEREEIGRLMHERIDEKIRKTEEEENAKEEIVSVPLYRRLGWYVAAALALVLSSVYYFNYSILQKPFTSPKMAVVQDINPGGNKAVLTLSNGSKVNLTDASKGNIAHQQGAELKLNQGGQLVYSSGVATATELIYNTIETRNGGQYQVVLPDGTKVWINAASSLRYPVNFVGNDRIVELSGEAYFEVAKNKAKPFKVVTAGQQVTVLGTHFNISAYPTENLTKTTLLEGSVKVNLINFTHSVIIKPGQQASVAEQSGEQKIEVQEVDADDAVAWKNGYFMFNNETLEDILRKISRWYDVEIVSTDPKKSQLRFSGSISRYSNVSQVLKKLELTESVRFKIEGRKIVVLP